MLPNLKCYFFPFSVCCLINLIASNAITIVLHVVIIITIEYHRLSHRHYHRLSIIITIVLDIIITMERAKSTIGIEADFY